MHQLIMKPRPRRADHAVLAQRHPRPRRHADQRIHFAQPIQHNAELRIEDRQRRGIGVLQLQHFRFIQFHEIKRWINPRRQALLDVVLVEICFQQFVVQSPRRQ